MRTIDLTITATMTDEKYADYARDFDVRDVPTDLASYLEHNLLRVSSVGESYLTDITVAVSTAPDQNTEVRS